MGAPSIYSPLERRAMRALHRAKAQMLRPLLVFLTDLGVRAAHMSVLGGASVVVGLLLAIAFDESLYAILGFFAHLLFDGIDGALARAQNASSVRGLLCDTFCDAVGVVCACLAVGWLLTTLWPAALLVAVLYVFVLAATFGLAVGGTMPALVIRPRLLLFGGMIADRIWGGEILRIVLFLSIALLAYSAMDCLRVLVPRLR